MNLEGLRELPFQIEKYKLKLTTNSNTRIRDMNITTTKERNLLSFEMQCLRPILGVTRLRRKQNTAIRAVADVNITERVCRKENTSIVYTAYTQDFVNLRPRGRPP